MSPLNLQIVGSPEKVILIYSPCRSGSTALLNALSMTDMHGIYQPIKAAARRLNAGDSEPTVIDAQTSGLIIKETLGPYFRAEVDFDPIGVLMEKGITPSQLHVVALFRRPEECLDSWIKTFRKDDVDLSLFGASYEAVYDDCVAAKGIGVHVVPMRYESLADPKTFPDLLSKLDIPFDPVMLDWSLSQKHQSGEFAFVNTPQPYHDTNSYDAVSQSHEFLVPKAPSTPAFMPDDITAKVAGLRSAQRIYNSGIDILAANDVKPVRRRNAVVRAPATAALFPIAQAS